MKSDGPEGMFSHKIVRDFKSAISLYFFQKWVSIGWLDTLLAKTLGGGVAHLGPNVPPYLIVHDPPLNDVWHIHTSTTHKYPPVIFFLVTNMNRRLLHITCKCLTCWLIRPRINPESMFPLQYCVQRISHVQHTLQPSNVSMKGFTSFMNKIISVSFAHSISWPW